MNELFYCYILYNLELPPYRIGRMPVQLPSPPLQALRATASRIRMVAGYSNSNSYSYYRSFFYYFYYYYYLPKSRFIWQRYKKTRTRSSACPYIIIPMKYGNYLLVPPMPPSSFLVITIPNQVLPSFLIQVYLSSSIPSLSSYNYSYTYNYNYNYSYNSNRNYNLSLLSVVRLRAALWKMKEDDPSLQEVVELTGHQGDIKRYFNSSRYSNIIYIYICINRMFVGVYNI